MEHNIAVLLPHYNNYIGLRLTLESLNQETEAFTLFIIDDASDNFDKLDEIINNFKQHFEIILIVNPINVGITETLNRGLKHILNLNKFTVVARLDAGDICVNDRFKNQLYLFSQDQDLYLVGSWVKFVDTNRKSLFIFKPPSIARKLKKVIHLYNPFIHPSVMFKIEVVKKIGYYPANYPALEDYAYFFQIVKSFKTSIIEKVLLESEVNPLGISSLKRRLQTKSRIRLLLSEYSFGFYQTIGLLRALITYLLPQKLLLMMKRDLFYN